MGQVECVKALLKHKDIDVNAREKNGITALMFAYNDGNKKIIKLIEKHLEKLEQKEAQQDTSETQPEQAQEEVLLAEIAQENEQKEQVKPILKREEADSKLIEMYKGGKIPFETLMNLCQDNPAVADEVWEIEKDKFTIEVEKERKNQGGNITKEQTEKYKNKIIEMYDKIYPSR